MSAHQENQGEKQQQLKSNQIYMMMIICGDLFSSFLNLFISIQMQNSQ